MDSKAKSPAKRALTVLDEFKAFAFKGNVIDLAVGVIIAGAFAAIVNSLVQNILMPLIGVIVPSRHGYENWVAVIGGKRIPFGRFIGDVVNFLIVTTALYLFIVKFMGWILAFRKEQAAHGPSVDHGPGSFDRDSRPAPRAKFARRSSMTPRSMGAGRALVGQPRATFGFRSVAGSRPCRVQDLLRRDVLHQLVWPQKVGSQRLPAAEQLLGLVVPVAALFVVALAERDDRIRLGRIGENHDLGRRLTGLWPIICLPSGEGAKLIARGVAIATSRRLPPPTGHERSPPRRPTRK